MFLSSLKSYAWKPFFLTVLLALTVFLPAHLLWFAQTPVWYPLRCLLNGAPVTLFLLLPALLSKSLFRPWLILTSAGLLVPAVLAGMHLFFFQATISQQSIHAVLESNLGESLEFITSQTSPAALLYLAAALALPLAVLRRLLKCSGGDFRASRAPAAALLLAACVLAGTGKLDRLARDNLACQLIRSILAYRTAMHDLDAYLERAAALRAPGVKSSSSPVTLVVLIGESSSRHHWGLYGYFRNTTPRLSAIENDLFVFRDAISPFGRTTLSVSAALTCSDVPGAGDIPLMTVFRQAGFETVWLSNQSTVDDSNMIVRLVSGADRKIYLNKGGDQAYARSYDEKILPALNALLSEPDAPRKRIIFVHTMGSHVNYGSRFPAGFDLFTQGDDIREKPWFTRKAKKYINDYDNSILYTDHIIASVVERLRDIPGGALLYFSDHGEEVFDTRRHHGHHDSLESRYYVDIPFLIWLSDSRKQAIAPETLERWQSARSVPFVNSAAPYVILDLCGVSFASPRMAESPLSPQFQISPRIIRGVDYDKRYPGSAGLKEPVPTP